MCWECNVRILREEFEELIPNISRECYIGKDERTVHTSVPEIL